MELYVNDLGLVQEEIFEARTKWYDIGLKLNVPVDNLDSIKSQFSDPKDCLRETLKVWLKTAGKSTWKTLVDALRSRTVGESRLAATLEGKHCVAALVKENEEQARQIQDLNQQMNRLQTEIQQLKARAQNLQEELRKSHSVIEHLRQELEIRDQKLQEKDQLQVALEAGQHEIQQLREELETRDQKKDQLRVALEDGQHEIQQLRQELETRDQQLQEKDLLQVVLETSSQREIQQLRQEVKQRDDQVQESQAEIFKAQQALDHLQQTEEVRQSKIQQLRHKLKERDRQVQELNTRNQQLEKKDDQLQKETSQQEIQQLQQEVDQLRHKLKERDRQVQETKEIIKARQSEIQQFKQELENRDQQLKAKDHKIQEKDEALIAQQKEIEELRSEHTEEAEKSPVTKKRKKNEDLHLQLREQPQAETTSGIQQKFICKELSKAPWESNIIKSAVIDGKMVYISDYTNMYAYDLDKMWWSMLLECPRKLFSLAVVKGQLTTIGGHNATDRYQYQCTNSLLSLTKKTIGKAWSEKFPPMKTARVKSVVAYNAKVLIVAGGYTRLPEQFHRYDSQDTHIEVMNTETEQWFEASQQLQKGSKLCTMAINGDILYIYTAATASHMIACSITELLQLGSSKGNIWYGISSVLVAKPTITTVRGQLMAISDKSIDDIHLYDSKNDSWRRRNVPIDQFKQKKDMYYQFFSVNGLVIAIFNCNTKRNAIFIPDFE